MGDIKVLQVPDFRVRPAAIAMFATRTGRVAES
jgi:hypothetical protein